MNAEFFNALDVIEKEKGIPKEYMIAKIEAALANACRKEVGPTAVVRVQLDPVKNDFRVFWQRTVVPEGEVEDVKTQISLPDAKAMSRRHKLGGVVEVELKTKTFRRLSAIAGKQMIIQAIRDAERERRRRRSSPLSSTRSIPPAAILSLIPVQAMRPFLRRSRSPVRPTRLATDSRSLSPR